MSDANKPEKTDFEMQAEMLFDALGQVIDNFLEISDKKKFDGCQSFNAISEVMAVRLGQIEALHAMHDFASKGRVMTADDLVKVVPVVTHQVVEDFLKGMNDTMKQHGGPNLADIKASVTAEEGDDNGGGGTVLH